ncbi:hypothetical protein QIS74_12988 [Colletotrichum tabaci]|uniref:F-box domain-containing protein n=1 Tax=Colletotrichum tabaci TaxID=1209068 RepID=A0AAV9SY38_9PEZI
MHSISPQHPVQVIEGITPQDETRKLKLAMVNMPPEVHHMIIDFLNVIDSTCLGLASHYFYQLHRRRHGFLPLSTTCRPPGDQELTRHLTGQAFPPRPSPDNPSTEAVARVQASSHTLTSFRACWCQICGFALCELWKHLRDWMPPGLEYCPVLGKYAPVQVADADAYCYRRNPRNGRVCGKHHWKEWKNKRRAMVG